MSAVPIRFYLGPATLILDGHQHRVIVRLESRSVSGQPEWSGQVRATDGLLREGLRAKDLRLELEGQERSIAVVSHAGTDGSAQVRGSGPAPF